MSAINSVSPYFGATLRGEIVRFGFAGLESEQDFSAKRAATGLVSPNSVARMQISTLRARISFSCLD